MKIWWVGQFENDGAQRVTGEGGGLLGKNKPSLVVWKERARGQL